MAFVACEKSYVPEAKCCNAEEFVRESHQIQSEDYINIDENQKSKFITIVGKDKKNIKVQIDGNTISIKDALEKAKIKNPLSDDLKINIVREDSEINKKFTLLGKHINNLSSVSLLLINNDIIYLN